MKKPAPPPPSTHVPTADLLKALWASKTTDTPVNVTNSKQNASSKMKQVVSSMAQGLFKQLERKKNQFLKN